MKCKKCSRLRSIIEDILWMAIRYAHGRHTYAPHVIRQCVKELKEIFTNFKVKCDDIIYTPGEIESKLRNSDYIGDYLDDLFAEK